MTAPEVRQLTAPALRQPGALGTRSNRGWRSVTSVHGPSGCGRGGVGAQRPRRRTDAGPGGARRGGVRGRTDGRGRDADRGADAGGVPPRRLLVRAPDVGGVALLPLPGPARNGRGAAPARGGLRPSVGRGTGGRRCTGASRRRRRTSAGTRRPTGSWSGRWWSGSTVSSPTCLGPMRRIPRDPLVLARFARVGAPSMRHVTRRFTTDSARALLGRRGGALHGAAHGAVDVGLRAPAHRAGPRRRLARRRGWQRGHHAGAGLRGAAPGRRGAHGPLGDLALRAPPGPCGAARRHPRQFVALAGPRLSRPGGPAVGALPARPRAPARWTGPSTAPCPGAPRRAGAP